MNSSANAWWQMNEQKNRLHCFISNNGFAYMQTLCDLVSFDKIPFFPNAFMCFVNGQAHMHTNTAWYVDFSKAMNALPLVFNKFIHINLDKDLLLCSAYWQNVSLILFLNFFVAFPIHALKALKPNLHNW